MQTEQFSSQEGRDLCVGDYVEVRPFVEISATLDAQGSLDGLPFMPEMISYCGRRFRVVKSAHKTCDPTGLSNMRRVSNAVHLETRCDGSAHDGCQAACLFFWRKEWLRRVDGPSAQGTPASLPPKADQSAAGFDLEALRRATRAPSPIAGETLYRCQATELVRFSTPLSPYEPKQYIRDLSSGNVQFVGFVRHFSVAASKAIANGLLGPKTLNVVKHFLRRLRRAPPESPASRQDGRAASRPLDLQPGELVRVRPVNEIKSTLDKDGKNRGLSFDEDMAQRAGGIFRVFGRVERIIDEKTGKMLRIRKDCVALEGVSCIGNYNRYRLFCPRGALQFWRECWLERVETGGPGAHVKAPQAATDKKSEYA